MSGSAFPKTVATMFARIKTLGPGADSAQWTRFWDLYAPAIRKYAARKGGEANADDIMMIVLGKLVTVLREGRFDPSKGAFHSYLATMISNEVHMQHRKDEVRKAGLHVSLDEKNDSEDPDREESRLAERLVAEGPSAPEMIDEDWRVSVLAAATEHALTKTALSDRDRDVYRQFVLEGRPLEEVAKRFHMTKNCVCQIKCRIAKRVEAIGREMTSSLEFGTICGI